MAFGTGTGRGRIRSDINVTPLVDVVLVLLIIFMVVTPLLQRGKDVKLPEAAKVDAQHPRTDPIVVSVTADRRVWLESDALGDAAFEAGLRARLAESPGRKVLLKGDKGLSFDDVRRVLALARGAGAKGVALGVEEVKK
ncbi:MAG: biopolymer transporter ExbD [Myxococcaceae bacterium]|nr:biopolymer transporter ExbD [Myxococcaceae bacterium]